MNKVANITVRKATLEDVGQVMEMAKKFHAASGYKDSLDIDFDQETFIHVYHSLLHSTDKVIFITEHLDKIVGMMAGGIISSYLNKNRMIATELAWWVDEEYRGTKAGLGLLKQFILWAKQKNVSCLFMMCLSDLEGERVGKLYDRMGFKKIEQTYALRLAGG